MLLYYTPLYSQVDILVDELIVICITNILPLQCFVRYSNLSLYFNECLIIYLLILSPSHQGDTKSLNDVATAECEYMYTVHHAQHRDTHTLMHTLVCVYYTVANSQYELARICLYHYKAVQHFSWP